MFRKFARRRSGQGTMATGPVVSVQSGSPAGELPISVQQGGNPTIIDRVKADDVTGAIYSFIFILLPHFVSCCVIHRDRKLLHYATGLTAKLAEHKPSEHFLINKLDNFLISKSHKTIFYKRNFL